MANLIATSNTPLYDGMPFTFRAACNCDEVEGLIVTYSGESKSFVFKDSQGNTLTGLGNLFAQDAYVRVILDTTNGFAYIQNAATNAYLEKSKAPAGHIAAVVDYDGTASDFLARINELYQGMDDLTEKHFVVKSEGVLQTETDEFAQGAWFVTIERRTASFGHAHATCNGDTMEVHDGEWSPRSCIYDIEIPIAKGEGTRIEWKNPPLLVGVEYCTMERYRGGPVYTMLADLGTTEATKAITTDVGTITNLIRAVPNLNAAVCDSWVPGSGINDENRFYFYAERAGTAVYCYTSAGTLRVGKRLYAQFWYTK